MQSNTSAAPKVAIIVPNVCDPDYRVVKQAEALAQAGYKVRVFCGVLQPTEAPDSETLGGVEYERRAWLAGHTLGSMFRSFIPFYGRPKYAPRPSKPKIPAAIATPVSAPQEQAVVTASALAIPDTVIAEAPVPTKAPDVEHPTPAAQRAPGKLMNVFLRGYDKINSRSPKSAEFLKKLVLRGLRAIKRGLQAIKRGLRAIKKSVYLLRVIWCKTYSFVKRHGIRFYRRTFVLFSKRVAFRYIKHHSFRYVFEEEIVDWQPDIIHVHDLAALYLGYKLSNRLNVPFIFDSHELEAHRSPPLSKLMQWQVHMLEQRCLPKAAAVTTVGQEISKYLAETYKIPAPHVIYNAPPKFPKPMAGRWAEQASVPFASQLRGDLDLEEEVVVLVYTGNIAINRGIEETLEALAYIKQHRQADFESFGPLHLALVGRCQPPVRAGLEEKIKALGLEGCVHFQAPVMASDVSRYISSATVSVIPIIPVALSYEYAMPNKLFEAMLAGLPILGSCLTEMSKTITAHSLGESFAHGNSEDFAGKLKLILSDRDRYLGATREAAIDQLCWETQENVLLSMFEDVLRKTHQKETA